MVYPIYPQANYAGGFFQALNALKTNPAAFLAQRGINLPQGVGNDPNAILQHLLSTGRVNQPQVQQAVQAAQQYR